MNYKLPRNYLVALAIYTVICLVLLFARNMLVGNKVYNFLLWNLFLAFLPLLFSWGVYFITGRLSKIFVVLGSLLWLLFYPNAPYMISDLIHVNSTENIVLYDTLIIFLFSMLALFYGFYSLKLIHLIYRIIAGTKTANSVITISVLLSSFGIYLGRILRLNSWDLFHHPLAVLKQIFEHVLPVSKNPTTYAIVFLFSTIQFILLIMMKDMDEVEKKTLISSKFWQQ